MQYTAGEAGRATDLEAAISEAITSLPSGLVPRLVLVSDGKENAGSITRAAWQAQHLGIPIDTIPLEGRASPNLRLESVSMPTLAFTGEQFPVDLNVSSPEAVSGTVEISAEGKLLGSNPVALEQGNNQIRVHASSDCCRRAQPVRFDSRRTIWARSDSIAPSLCGVPRCCTSRRIRRALRHT